MRLSESTRLVQGFQLQQRLTKSREVALKGLANY